MKPSLLSVLAAPFLLLLAACAGTAPRATAAADTLPGGRAATALPADDLRAYRLPVPPAPPAAGPEAGAKAPVPAPAAPRPPAPLPTNQVNAQVEQRLRDQAYTNQAVKYAQGFRLLVYLGLERDQAMAIRRAVIGRYPDETDYLSFKAPVYRLYVGDYLTRLDAARARARLRGLTQRAEVEATQVLINKNP
ncbi:hypothetical protein ACFQ48_08075 [Hymenobacter caeli]|uniref:SPOR domain-containing protein n=1 Tax=Hymenobacter caeli TaxID=2735894 RepID=A0ABX2FNT2_9BACT|nr:hypothetical protein [Hymenobacter caeli]NRT18201.1 hypothetical protein [Hymenobacter caeli]